MKNVGMAEGNALPSVGVRFALLCLLLYAVAVVLPDSFYAPLNRATASLAAWCIGLFGGHADVAGEIISLNGFRVRIIDECTAVYSIVVFGAFVASTPASLRARLAGLSLGAALLCSANIVRIAAVTIVGAKIPWLFELFHIYLGQIVMLILVIATALIWLRWNAAAADPFPFVLRALVVASVLFLPWVAVNRVYVAAFDEVVKLLFHMIFPDYALNTPRPLTIYNHTLAVPLFFSLVMASRDIGARRRIGGVIAGVLILAGWHTLFRITHVIWTAYHVNEIEPFHKAVYLLGQYLLPFLLWFLLVVRSPRAPEEGRTDGKRLAPLALLLLALVWPTDAGAAATITVKPNGSDGFYLSAGGLNDISAGEIRIEYVSDEPAAPSVAAVGFGAKTSFQAVTNTPGNIVIRFTAAKPLRGNGYLANVRMTGQGGGFWQVTSLFAVLKNDKGVEEMVGTSIVNPPANEKNKGSADTGADRQRQVRPAPGQVAPDSGATPRKSAAPVASSSPSSSSSPSPPRSGPVSFRRLEGVLDRFRAHAGERTRDALGRLFAPVGGREFRQEPEVVLADGVAEVRVAIRPAGEGEEVDSFIIRGAHCSSLLRGDAGEWLLALVPERGTLTASVTAKTGQAMVEYPLTVAPPLSLFRAGEEGGKGSYLYDFVSMANERAARQ
ncbi:MAG: hypothetical protein FD174_1627 [Geobacteraceae bacterium]|nr:MAG: hypothetical protein FD174_1627 [Geobacteraceae bacterium]